MIGKRIIDMIFASLNERSCIFFAFKFFFFFTIILAQYFQREGESETQMEKNREEIGIQSS